MNIISSEQLLEFKRKGFLKLENFIPKHKINEINAFIDTHSIDDKYKVFNSDNKSVGIVKEPLVQIEDLLVASLRARVRCATAQLPL